MSRSRVRKYINRVPPYVMKQMQQVSSDPSATASIVAATGITVTNRIMRVQGSGGPVTITATPHISDKFTVDGFELILEGRDDTNLVTLQDEVNLPGSGLHLEDTLDKTLGKGDILRLIYNATDRCWYQSAPMTNN